MTLMPALASCRLGEGWLAFGRVWRFGRLTQRQLAVVRAFRSPTTGRLTPPFKSCIHRVLTELAPDVATLPGRRQAFRIETAPASGALRSTAVAPSRARGFKPPLTATEDMPRTSRPSRARGSKSLRQS